jgi:hypothetical protein
MLWILFFVAVVYLAVKLYRRRRPRSRVAAGKHPLDLWLEEALARALATRLELDEPTVHETLRGAPEPDTVSAIEEAVRTVDVRFEKLPGNDGAEVEVRVEASLERGQSCVVTRRMALSELPAPVREDFARKGSVMIFRSWGFPWASPRPTWDAAPDAASKD